MRASFLVLPLLLLVPACAEGTKNKPLPSAQATPFGAAADADPLNPIQRPTPEQK
jgi:hypothetical protein